MKTFSRSKNVRQTMLPPDFKYDVFLLLAMHEIVKRTVIGGIC